jgi:hypothetical protein
VVISFCLAATIVNCSTLMAAHCTAGLRHDAVGQETLLNLLLRNYLAYNLYDQVRASSNACSTCSHDRTADETRMRVPLPARFT